MKQIKLNEYQQDDLQIEIKDVQNKLNDCLEAVQNGIIDEVQMQFLKSIGIL